MRPLYFIIWLMISFFTCGTPASGVVQTMSGLTSANIGSWAGSYGYKLDGNLENRTENGLSEPFEYDFDNNGTDESNMLSEIAGNPISWDKNGWLTSDGMHSFSYDYDGKMQVATSIADPDITVTYQYDPMGNRVGRVETDANGVVVSEKKYILDYSSKVPKVLLEMAKVSGNWQIIQKNYYYGNMLVMSTDGSNQNRRYYIHDRLGSVRVVTNRDIAVLNNYTFSPFGEDLTSQTTETVDNDVRFAGYNYDKELAQYYVWARMYSPYMARFNGYDPVLGDFKEPLTLHQYLYCQNDPINAIDRDGRFLTMLGGVATDMYNRGKEFAVKHEMKERLTSSIIKYASHWNGMVSGAMNMATGPEGVNPMVSFLSGYAGGYAETAIAMKTGNLGLGSAAGNLLTNTANELLGGWDSQSLVKIASSGAIGGLIGKVAGSIESVTDMQGIVDEFTMILINYNRDMWGDNASDVIDIYSK